MISPPAPASRVAWQQRLKPRPLLILKIMTGNHSKVIYTPPGSRSRKHALAAWAHMLGFRGHFSTKSRHYSTTFGVLRAERAKHRRDHATVDSLWPVPEDDTTLVLADWRFAGQGQPPITPPSADTIRSETTPLGPPEGGQP